jgi:N-acetyl-gamma-glutamyl-phosphate reductase
LVTQVFVDGGHGTTGLEIVERLTGRAEFSLITLDDSQRKDMAARRDAINAADVVFLCLPDDAAREAVALVDNPHTRIIDASTAHRTADGWAFGFHEIEAGGKERLAAAKRISNPGCYSTGFVALVRPLVDAGLIPADWPLSVNAVSGYSGGGKAMIAEFEQSGTDTAWRTYALSLAHKHVPEMQHRSGLIHAPLFAPAVARTYRGMVVDVPLMTDLLPGKPDPDAIRAVLAARYAGSPIVNFIGDYDEALLTIEHAAGSDRLDLFVFANADGTRVRLTAALDNLGKGASGAAVQSLNLISGLDETAGLKL